MVNIELDEKGIVKLNYVKICVHAFGGNCAAKCDSKDKGESIEDKCTVN